MDLREWRGRGCLLGLVREVGGTGAGDDGRIDHQADNQRRRVCGRIARLGLEVATPGAPFAIRGEVHAPSAARRPCRDCADGESAARLRRAPEDRGDALDDMLPGRTPGGRRPIEGERRGDLRTLTRRTPRPGGQREREEGGPREATTQARLRSRLRHRPLRVHSFVSTLQPACQALRVGLAGFWLSQATAATSCLTPSAGLAQDGTRPVCDFRPTRHLARGANRGPFRSPTLGSARAVRACGACRRPAGGVVRRSPRSAGICSERAPPGRSPRFARERLGRLDSGPEFHDCLYLLAPLGARHPDHADVAHRGVRQEGSPPPRPDRCSHRRR